MLMSKFIKRLIVMLLMLSPYVSAKQSFEGVITYKIELESRNGKLPIEVLRQIYGEELKVFYKYGYTKHVYIGGDGEWEVYNSAKNKQYLKMRGNPEIEVLDGSDETRVLKGVLLTDSTVTVLNKNTQFLTIQYQDDIESKYWFSSEIYIDPSQFEKLQFGYLNQYWDKAKAPYLKHERDHGDWVVTHVAITVEEKALDTSVFLIGSLVEGRR